MKTTNEYLNEAKKIKTIDMDFANKFLEKGQNYQTYVKYAKKAGRNIISRKEYKKLEKIKPDIK